ncbi:hypothetical protein OG292_03930 [Streptomyces sp. NBC_01511]|uniref:hypothetical protein n=1 Tax=unclassified Streptomyces TaxID=2593676 RepID=UPI00386F4BF7
MITADDRPVLPAALTEGRRSTALDVMSLSLSAFRTHGPPGGAHAWDRYAFVHSQVLLDRLDGTITQLVEEKAVLEGLEAHRLVRSELDVHINSLYRSVKGHHNNRPAVAHLFATVERAARRAGHGSVLDSWGTDTDLPRPRV